MKHLLFATLAAVVLTSGLSHSRASAPVPAADEVPAFALQASAPTSHTPSLLEFVLGGSCLLGMAVENRRRTEDLNLREVVNLPAAAATADTPGIDLVTTTGGRVPNIELRIYVPATASLANTKTITLTVQHSDDDGAADAYAAVTDIGVRTITGVDPDGGGELDVNVKLPIDVKRFVRLHVAVEAAGGDNTDIIAELGLVF